MENIENSVKNLQYYVYSKYNTYNPKYIPINKLFLKTQFNRTH